MTTIKDVARTAGVGVATASRALSGKGSVSEVAQERVRAAAASLAYRPSSIARALSLQRSDAVGLYLPIFDTGFYARILSSVDATLRAADRHLIVANGCGPGDQRQRALDGIDFLIGRDCDGLIVASHHLRNADLLDLRRCQPHLVLINRVVPRMAGQCIRIEHDEGGRLAARALLSTGHRRIATVGGAADAVDNAERMAGFHAELAVHDLAPVLELDGQFTHSSGAAAAERLMTLVDRTAAPAARVSAVFCANDLMAVGLTSRLQRAGWRVPEDLAVIGYDDADLAPYVTPRLTTVRVPIAEAAAAACARVLQLRGEAPAAPVEREHRCAVVWRDSVGPGPHPPLGPAPVTHAAALERGEYTPHDQDLP